MPQNKRKFVAWRLRLTKGAKEASHNDLEAAEAWLENFEIFCGAMVFFGVTLEVVIAIDNPPFGSFVERWGSPIADAFVALGVFGEVLANARGRVIQGELTRRSNDRLADAEERAATANREAAIARLETANLQRDFSIRIVDPGILSEALRNRAKASVEVLFETPHPECRFVAEAICEALQMAMWEIPPPKPVPHDFAPNGQSWFLRSRQQISILTRAVPDHETNPDHALWVLFNAFRKNFTGVNVWSEQQMPADHFCIVVSQRPIFPRPPLRSEDAE